MTKQRKAKRKAPMRDPQTVQMTGRQRSALVQWQRDFQKVLPKIAETTILAKRIFQEMVDAPQWHITEAPRPDAIAAPEAPENWSVGHAKVNITDEREGKE